MRESAFRRYTLSRESKTIQTRMVIFASRYRPATALRAKKPEFDDLAKIARKTGKSLSELQKKHLNHKSAAAHRQNVNRGVSFQNAKPARSFFGLRGRFYAFG